MADSSIAVTPGAGANVDTRTEAGGDHRQVIVIGDETTTNALVTVSNNGAQVTGDEAHDVADAGNPVKIGGRARTSAITAVANDDRVDAVFSTTGGKLISGSASGVPTDIAVNSSGQPLTIAQGNQAHDGVDSGNPIKLGHKAVDHSASPTAVAAADRTDWYANRHGIPFVIGGHMNVVAVRANYTAAQTDTAIVTISTGNKIIVTRIMVTADNANTVDVAVRIGFGTANTPTTAGVVAAHPGIPAGGGFVTGDGSGILGIGADNEDLRITSEVPTTGSIDVIVSYYLVPA